VTDVELVQLLGESAEAGAAEVPDAAGDEGAGESSDEGPEVPDAAGDEGAGESSDEGPNEPSGEPSA
jgi:hypothetical protein